MPHLGEVHKAAAVCRHEQGRKLWGGASFYHTPEGMSEEERASLRTPWGCLKRPLPEDIHLAVEGQKTSNRDARNYGKMPSVPFKHLTLCM